MAVTSALRHGIFRESVTLLPTVERQALDSGALLRGPSTATVLAPPDRPKPTEGFQSARDLSELRARFPCCIKLAVLFEIIARWLKILQAFARGFKTRWLR